jgi:uncharacterized membrane protein
MKFFRFLCKPATPAPLPALVFASVVDVALVAGWVFKTRNSHYAYLVWNLFLAWLPLVFALAARRHFHEGRWRDWRCVVPAVLWLLFFPNAPYIFTDLIHLLMGFFGHFWVDLVLILMCALTGLLLGFVSLHLMHAAVEKIWGRAAGWTFVTVASGLGGLGIYLGRFFRLNSWDVITRPGQVYHTLGAWSFNSPYAFPSVAFPVLFSVFLFTSYVMLHALTRMPEFAEISSGRSGENPVKAPAK